MNWPLPSKLLFASAEAQASTTKVEVQLLDGQLIHALMKAGDIPAQKSELKLAFMGREINIPIAAIRTLACANLLLAASQPEITGGQATETELPFQASFIDGKTLAGSTFGYINKQAGGVYLYVKQDDFRFKALWIPRSSLQSIRVDRTNNSIASAPPGADLATAAAIEGSQGQQASLPAKTMQELSALLETARWKPMLPVAQAMFELKLIDSSTLQHMLADKPGKLREYIDERLAKSESFRFDFEHVRAYMVKTPEVNVEAFQVEPPALTKIPWALALKHAVVPLGSIAGKLYVASALPMQRELEDRLTIIAGSHVTLVWAAKSQIEARIAREIKLQSRTTDKPQQDSSSSGIEGKSQDLQALLASAQEEIKVEGGVAPSNAIDERSSVVLLVKRMITDAYQQKASDIHIEANVEAEPSKIRFRIDGDLEDYLQLPLDLRAAMVSRIKVMSRLDISERRRPQDGKINFGDFSTIKLELRVAILPTHDNLEDVVMRLLASSKPIPLAQLGFSIRDAEIVKRLSRHPYGLLLACGPTGSGKTTTLHSLLSEINTSSRKIWTAEDPIEITQSGLRQLQVNSKIGLTFAAAMRAFLRADPDVIMIGEVRDEETARVCIEASLTGHLVFSTLHTNGAAESVIRLLDLGMDPLNFGDSLIGIVAQRLVHSLCKHCASTKLLTDRELDELVAEYVAGTAVTAEEGKQRLLAAAAAARPKEAISIREACGCDQCSGRGYKGRMGVYEVLENVGNMKRKIQTRAPTAEIFAEASRAGMRTLRQDALEKVVGGFIDMQQARTVSA
jgi:type II secretory ATPase GspE/PulE/Tfp pilus assembly ATPase PilB-like protein